MIGAIAAWLVGRGVSERVARPIAWAGLIGIAVFAFFAWLAIHDGNVIEQHEAEVQLETERGARRADQSAVDRRERREEQQAQDRQEFDNATDHIPPEGLTRRQRHDLCLELRDAGIDTAGLPQCVDVRAGAEAGPVD